jgi:hypothetical protein
MSIRKAIFSISIGFFLAIFVIGLLPFLAIYSWAETFGNSELYTSPLLFLNFIYKDEWMTQGKRASK